MRYDTNSARQFIGIIILNGSEYLDFIRNLWLDKEGHTHQYKMDKIFFFLLTLHFYDLLLILKDPKPRIF